MKALAPIFALLALATALTAAAGAQQQTFSTNHAGPAEPVPIITPQPLYYDGYYYPYPFNCNNRFSGGSQRGMAQGHHFNNSNHGNPCSASGRPQPSHHPAAQQPMPHPT